MVYNMIMENFLITVIIPIYNAEKYLSEAIDSVVAQTIGFKQNIQVVLVNNATLDNSEAICMKYEDLYPQNITYIKLEKNVGPAGARNAGIPFIKGKYVNFLDSDDKWEVDAFEKAIQFFEKHYEEIDLVSCRVHDFEAWDRWHPLDYTFSSDRVVNIFDEYDCIKTMITSTLIKSEVVCCELMDCSILYAEDTKYVTQIILRCGKYGVLRSAVFWYRRHEGEDSTAYKMKAENGAYYRNVMQKLHLELHELSRKKYGYVIPYLQYIDAYYLQWRLRDNLPRNMSEDELQDYRAVCHQVLQDVEDNIIFEQKHIWKEDKLFLLCLKYGRDIREKLIKHGTGLYFNNIKAFDLTDKMNLQIKNMHINSGKLCLDGQLNYPLPENSFNIYAQDNLGNRYSVKIYRLGDNKTVIGFGVTYHKYSGFSVEIPLTSQVSFIKLYVDYKGYSVLQTIRFGNLVRLSDKAPWSHHEEGGYSIRFYASNKMLLIFKDSKEERIYSEKKYLKTLFKQGHKKVFVFRQIISQLLLHKKKKGYQIWLFTDRIATADDNGEFLLEYAEKQNNPDIKCYYVLSKDSADYQRMKKSHNVVAYRSIKFYILFAMADWIITSIFDRYFFESFGVHHEYVKDLFQFRTAYLQHCVLIDDLSKIQNKFNEDMSLFITTAKAEYDAMFDYPYGYDESVVKLTGMPRYDILEECRNQPHGKNILFAPTYRMKLNQKSGLNKKTGRWDYSEKYKDSDYFKFYNGLINDSRILACMRRHGYTGTLRLHPAAMSQACDFESNDIIKVHTGSTDYRGQFRDNCFVITDYSTTAVDYAYVGIPVVYTQFDVDTFYINHTYMPGFFNYEKDGFGPVCYDYESAVKEIIHVIENECVTEEKYQIRRQRFFTFNDHNNCKRIYDEILKTSEET